MTTRNVSENESENKSVRIHYLEQQVRMMRSELRHIRKDLVPQEDLRRFRNLSDKLNELNTLLYELRNNYKRLQQPRKFKNVETSLKDNNYLKQPLPHEHNMTCGQQQKRIFVDEKNFLPQYQLGGEEKKFEEKEIQTDNNDKGNLKDKRMQSSERRQQEKHDERHSQPRLHLAEEINSARKQFDEQKLKGIEKPRNGNIKKISINLDPVEDIYSTRHQLDQNKLKEIEKPRNGNIKKLSMELDAKVPFKSCQELMDEIRTPGSILGNYLMKLQDFRTDPELRRQRLEKKLQEKLLLHQIKPNIEKETKIFDKGNETIESIRSSSGKNYENHIETFNNIHQTATQTNEYDIIESATMLIPPDVPKSIKTTPQRSMFTETSAIASPIRHDSATEPVETQKLNSETQTESNEFYDLNITANDKSLDGFLQSNQTPENEYHQFTSTSQSSYTQQSDSESGMSKNLPLIQKNLQDVVYSIVQNIDLDTVALTVVLEADNLYHINISVTTTGQSLSCLYATEAAVQQAKNQNLFNNILTFFVVNSDNTLGQKDRILGHSFEFQRRPT